MATEAEKGARCERHGLPWAPGGYENVLLHFSCGFFHLHKWPKLILTFPRLF